MNNPNNLHDLFNQQINKVNDLSSLEQLNLDYLGRKGKINTLFTQLKKLPADQLKSYAVLLNQLKSEIEQKITDKKQQILSKVDTQPWFDATLPSDKFPLGTNHPISYIIDEIIDIFDSLGFAKTSYREVEYEYFSFDSLNMPLNHPGRDDFESFFVNARVNPKYGKMILSPHTSSCQIREMKRIKTPPIKTINITKCFRPNSDVSHTPMFHQFEAICIDRGINMTNLQGTIQYFINRFYDNKRKIRLRPFHFQFTEPSFEVDISCSLCNGTGIIDKNKCRLCKSGWLELSGAGMIHPYVLSQGGIDSKKYTGWAFAFGLERLMMMKPGIKIEDMRILYNGELEFLKQF